MAVGAAAPSRGQVRITGVRPASCGSDPSYAPSSGATACVVLATLAVPFDEETAGVAAQAALESGARLIVVDLVEQVSSPMWPPHSFRFAQQEIELAEDRAQIGRVAREAAGLGLEVEHLRVRTPRPVVALLEVVAVRRAELLVLGPDPARLKPRVLRRAVRQLRRRAPCLLWIVGEGP
jgi:nucleotide-binding universal stress UspA family protein